MTDVLKQIKSLQYIIYKPQSTFITFITFGYICNYSPKSHVFTSPEVNHSCI